MKLPLWRLTTWRRKLWEALGLERYSRPAAYDIERKLERYFPDPGFFVEAGAVDGYFESNTYYLQKFKGWSGILIEPSPAMFSRISINRQNTTAFNCALVSFDYTQPTVELTEAHALSGIFDAAEDAARDARLAQSNQKGNRSVKVPARTLQSIMEEVRPPAIDLLSLDVEGYETQVLNGIDLTSFRPRYILVESLDEPRRRKIEEQLAPWYDPVEEFSYRDVLYRRREI